MKRYLYLFLIIPFLLSCGAGGGGGSNENGSGDGADNTTGKTNPLCTSVSKVAKIRIKEDGVYRISYTDIYNSCLDLYGVDINTLKMTNQGEEIAIEVIDNDSNAILSDADYIDFYGKAISREDDSFRYTDTNIYWLFIEDGTRKRIERTTNDSQTTQPLQSFLKTIHMEEDTHYVQGISTYPSLTEHWFWGEAFYTPEFICGNTPLDECKADAGQRYSFQRDFSFNVPHLDNTIPVNLKIHLQDVSGDHNIKVSINNKIIIEQTWNNQDSLDLVKVLDKPADYLFEDGTNVLTIESVGGTNSIYDLFYLDWFEVSYYHTYQAEHDYIEFTGKDYIEATDFVSKKINVYEITDHANVQKIIPIKIDSYSGRYKVRFSGKTNTEGRFIAVTDDEKKLPYSIEANVPSDIRAKNAASYIIITHEDFYDAIIPLADYRIDLGHNVLTVKIGDVYNEFSYGIETPHAIRDFLTYAYDNNWSTKYVLLVGDATVDYKDLSGYGESQGVKSYIPAYLYNYSGLGEVPTDNWFVDVDKSNGILPEMSIGRIPAKDAEDVTAVVNKIIAHENTSNPLSGKILLIADDIRDEYQNIAPPEEQTFEILSDDITRMVPTDSYSISKLYQRDYYPDDAGFRAEILYELNSGPLILNYTGHGSVDKWTKETVFSSEDIGYLQNKNNYPFVVALNCLNGYFVLPDDNVTKGGEMQYPSIAETFLLSPGQGAVAVFAASAIGYPSEHDPLAEALYSEIFSDGETVLGDAVIKAKNVFSTGKSEDEYKDVIQTFIFFGDPATRLK